MKTFLLLLCVAATAAAGPDPKLAAQERAAAQKLLKKGDKAGAAAAFLRAAKADPSDVASLNDAAFVFIGLKKFAEAKSASEQAVTAAAGDDARKAAALYNLGRAQEGLTLASEARSSYLESLALKFSKDAVARAAAGASPEQAVRLVDALVKQLSYLAGGEEMAEVERGKVMAAVDQLWTKNEFLRALSKAKVDGLKGSTVHDAGFEVRYVDFDTGGGGTMPDRQMHLVSCDNDGCEHQKLESSATYADAAGFMSADDAWHIVFTGTDQMDSCHGEAFAEVWSYDAESRKFKQLENAFPKGKRVAVPWDCNDGPAEDAVDVRIVRPEGSLCVQDGKTKKKYKRDGVKFVAAGGC